MRKNMNAMANVNDRRMTLKEIAEKTGAAYSTVAAYAQKAGWTENGKQTLLDEREVGLGVIQRIAEAGGLMLSDGDDVMATYGRRRR